MAAVHIGNPLSRVLAVIQVQHGGHRVEADAVGVVLVRPEHGVGNQEIRYLGPSVIVDQRSPVRVGSLSRILMLVDAGSVELGHSPGIPRKMSRNPV